MNIKNLLEDIIKKAQNHATEKHTGQTRRSGEPYIAHPERVAEIVKKFKKSHKIEDLVSSAWLHDTIEDTGETEENLKKLFNPLISSLVAELTSDKSKIKEIGKGPYLANKMIGMSSWGLVIKLADRLDNVSDLKTANESFRKRYSEETKFILDKLEKERKLSNTQQALIKAIKIKLSEL